MTALDTWTTVVLPTVPESRLTLHCGAARVPWETVIDTPTPDPTDTHFPVPHARVVELVVDSLAAHGLAVRDSAHALSRNGAHYFGLLSLRGGAADGRDGYGFALALRNAHDGQFRAAALLGTQVWACDNLAFAGGESVFAFGRKHTKHILRDLPGLVHEGLSMIGSRMLAESDRVDAYRGATVEDMARRAGCKPRQVVDHILVEGIRRGAVSPNRIGRVLHEWDREDGPGGHAGRDASLAVPTAWRLLNAMTEVEREVGSICRAPSRTARFAAIIDPLVGIDTARLLANSATLN